MINIDINNLPVKLKVDVICDDCSKDYTRQIKGIKLTRKKYNRDVCTVCAYKIAASKRPQNSKIFWTDDKKKQHGEHIKVNENYINGLKTREDNSGENNPMFGKKHKIETKQKMSVSRTGKIGENATAWKGGINTLTNRVKGFQYRNDWYGAIYARDFYKCVKCSSKTKIEVHHIKPMYVIVNEIKNNFKTEDETYSHLINMPINIELDNGITLCRECHKKEHVNWGSHNPKVK